MINVYENKEQMSWYMEMIEKYSSELSEHCKRTAELSLRLSKGFKVDMDRMYQAALVHDLGKTLLPEKILDKTEPLTNEEKSFIDTHSVLGYQMLKRDNVDVQICQMILFHHGIKFSFYKGLENASEQTILAADIIRVADAFDALTSERAYRKNISADQALYIMKTDRFFNAAVLCNLKKII